jgi:hypothetical protein
MLQKGNVYIPKRRTLGDVENAIVLVSKKGGRGVLVSGNLIITAAHCIDYSTNGQMMLGDLYIENIKTAKGEIKASPLAVEPVSDIAVLGSLDSQAFADDADRFDRFCECTKPVPLCTKDFDLFKKFPVYISNHDGKWVRGMATQGNTNANALAIEADEQIEGGASGGPIITESGELVGIVSQFNESHGDGKCDGMTPRPHISLPVWVCRKILGPKGGLWTPRLKQRRTLK